MRKLTAISLAAVIGACGGDDDDDDNGGGGGGGTSLTMTGPITFTAAEVIFFAASQACPAAGDTPGYAASVLSLAFSDATGLCGLVQGDRDPANAGALTLFISRFRGGSASPTPIGPGTYTVQRGFPTLGVLTFAGALLAKNDATCNSTEATATAGSITLTNVTATAVQGTVDLTFNNGGTANGSFTASACAISGLGDLCTDTPDTDPGGANTCP